MSELNQAIVNRVEALCLKAVGDLFEGAVDGDTFAWSPGSMYKDVVKRILDGVVDAAKEWGRRYKDEIEAGAKRAVDRIAAWDIPRVPDWIEVKVDEAFTATAYKMIEHVMETVFTDAIIFSSEPIDAEFEEDEGPDDIDLGGSLGPVEEEAAEADDTDTVE